MSIFSNFICSTQGGVIINGLCIYFVPKYFKLSGRHNSATGKSGWYYRLVESYRNADDRVCHRTMLNVGFLEDLTADQKQIYTLQKEKNL